MVIFAWAPQIMGPTESQTLIQKFCGQAEKTSIFSLQSLPHGLTKNTSLISQPVSINWKVQNNLIF